MAISAETVQLLRKLSLDSPAVLAAFCERWKIARLEGFGSILREDFGPQSDVDVLYSFEEGAEWTLFEVMAMEEELEQLFHRKVDFVSRRAIEEHANRFIKQEVLARAVELYAA